ncbi:MAG: molybdate ABC transporter substrate-binding protein [Stellaceae bacterium]
MPIHATRLVAAAVMLLAGLTAGAAGAAEIKVVSAGAMRAALEELAPAFEKASGNKLKIEYATAGKVEEEVAADEEIDVAILTKPRADKLVGKAKLVGGTSTMLARVPIALAVKKGAAKPDIGSVEAFKKALLGAKSIAYNDPASGATSGIHMAQVLDKLGIAAELKPKIHLGTQTAGKGVGDLVAQGEAEIGILPASELTGVGGVDVVGPLPAELQSPDLVFVAASPMISERPLPAKALIDFLSTPAAKAVYKAKGMEPG